MKTCWVLLPLALACVAALAEDAQPPKKGHDGMRRPPPPPLLVAIDKDKDGELSTDEIAGAKIALLSLDKNGDGRLDRAEIRPPLPHDGRPGPEDKGGAPEAKGDGPEGKRPPHPPIMPVMVAVDKDKDGELSADEINGAAEALKTLDKNGDGKLTREEIFPRPQRPEGTKGGHGEGQGQGQRQHKGGR